MKNSSGVTLVELIVTLIIGAFMLLTVGIILVYSQVLWQKSSQTSDIQTEGLSARAIIGYSFRNATTNLSGYPFVLDGSGHSLRYTSIDPANSTYVLSRIRLSGKEVLYDYWLASTDALSQHVWFATTAASAGSMRLFSDVQSLHILEAGTDLQAVSFSVRQMRVTDQSSGGYIQRTTTFTIKGRNRYNEQE